MGLKEENAKLKEKQVEMAELEYFRKQVDELNDQLMDAKVQKEASLKYEEDFGQ